MGIGTKPGKRQPPRPRVAQRPPTASSYEGLNLNFVGGTWRGGKSGSRSKDYSPWTGEVLLEFELASVDDVNEAYAASVEASRDWWKLTSQRRADVLRRAVELMDARREEIVGWIVDEAGSTRVKAELEWLLARAITEEASSFPSRMAGAILPSSTPGMESRVYRLPAGVATVISPFNFPWHLSMRAVAPALACGNAVVLKPASDTPVSGGTLVGKLFEEAGVPRGVIQVLVGAGRDIGDAVIDHPVPRVVSFTGSTRIGQHVGEICGRRVKKVCLELGGNAPMLIFDDADLDQAVDAAIFGKFMHQGQICMAVNRLLVHRRIHDSFVERFVEKAKQLRVGDKDDDRSTIGPIINEKQRDSILDRVRRSKAAGARVALEGEPKGLIIPPIVLVDVTNDMPCAREENFGPVAPIIPFDSDEQGIALANDTLAGLSAAVFTSDAGRGERVASQIAAGMVHINDSPVNDEPNTAFGGVKQSGVGRFGGDWAIDAFTEIKWVSLQRERRRYPNSIKSTGGM